MSLNQVNIEERSTEYDITNTYHSDMKCENYDAIIIGTTHSDGKISVEPNDCGRVFEFTHSDPDRVIAIANMMLAFAQMVKNENKKTIDTSVNA